MIDKIIEFIKKYSNNIEEAIKKIGKYKTISIALNLMIERESFAIDELRKALSLYIRRIISEKEFKELLDYDKVEYAYFLYR